MKYLLWSFCPFRLFKKGSYQFLTKECAQRMVRGLSLPRKSVVRQTDGTRHDPIKEGFHPKDLILSYFSMKTYVVVLIRSTSGRCF